MLKLLDLDQAVVDIHKKTDPLTPVYVPQIS